MKVSDFCVSKITKVSDKLYRGRYILSPLKMQKLKSMGVNQIIDLRNNSPYKLPLEKVLCKLFDMKYVNLPYSHRMTTLPKTDFFCKVANTIDSNNGASYIHCIKGKRRTGVCVAFYELLKGKSNEKVLDDLKKIGFAEFTVKKQSTKAKKYRHILAEFINKYIRHGGVKSQ